ncbi:hypothetical protein Sta7437_0137 [Stanieria cyanosphaera PCC 7437]|uniref:Uncharacterized protein n=1 Tax=Stanieria cyanosphaera (strain ATCC 29371 / PCC 7437) TaxID=111780 RepID=K9XNY6_STAC7|nr:hypothetical protein [Stanieria cyanosphaera]AFZ33756.1 hypothetical protein Sta7437_0137 [Stanieria cyanosphaera PCC 7437]
MSELESKNWHEQFIDDQEKISQNHQKIADKCAQKLIELGERLQAENEPGGKSIAEHGQKILHYTKIEQEKTQQASEQNEVNAYESTEIAAQQRRKATQEHVQAIEEYNAILLKKIQANQEKSKKS